MGESLSFVYMYTAVAVRQKKIFKCCFDFSSRIFCPNFMFLFITVVFSAALFTERNSLFLFRVHADNLFCFREYLLRLE